MTANLNPYPAMKHSGVEWLEQVPEHWSIERAKVLLNQVVPEIPPAAEMVTCFRDGQVTLRGNRRTEGFTNAIKELGYQGIRPGQLVLHSMDAFAGAIGVSDSAGKCSPEYVICEPVTSGVDLEYYSSLLRSLALRGLFVWLCPSVRERAPRVRFSHFGGFSIPQPPFSEQAAIVRYLDHVDRRVRRLVLAKQKLITLLIEQRKNATLEAIQSPSTTSQRLEVVADLTKRPIDRTSDETYTPIGLYNRGRGIFKKESRNSNDLGDSDFFWIEEDDLVISGQFAWEGSIALASSAEAGCVASHRYPIVRGKPAVLDSGFLLAFFQTDWGQLLLDHHSRGAAGRNRPLNARTLLKEKISLPPLAAQQRVAEMVKLESRARRQVDEWSKLLNEYRIRLIADVVTGKLDVREVAASLPNERPEKERKPLGKKEIAEDVKMRDTTDLNTVSEEAET